MKPILVLLACTAMMYAQQAPAPCLERAPQDRAYTKERLLAMVADQTPVRAGYLIRTCGVRTPWSAQLETELRAAGAEDRVIQAVKEKAPEPQPPSKAKPSAEPSAEPKAGDVREHSKDGQRYAYIPPGNFRMGCSPGDGECYDDEKLAHDVRITTGFWIGQTEVPVAAYKRFTRSAKRDIPSGSDVLPINVDRYDARTYCSWAGLRLPTEAEWEYAARAGSAAARYGELDEIAWYSGNSEKALHPVRQKRANAFQLFDMLGNVFEWTADWYGAYSSAAVTDPKGPATGEGRVVRGGSRGYYPRLVRLSGRYRNLRSFQNIDIGFRCVGQVPFS